MTDEERPQAWMIGAVAVLYLGDVVLSAAIVVGFIFESRRAALVAIAALVGVLAVHLLVSAVEYRRTMRRPWPSVAPLPADDDD